MNFQASRTDSFELIKNGLWGLDLTPSFMMLNFAISVVFDGKVIVKKQSLCCFHFRFFVLPCGSSEALRLVQLDLFCVWHLRNRERRTLERTPLFVCVGKEASSTRRPSSLIPYFPFGSPAARALSKLKPRLHSFKRKRNSAELEEGLAKLQPISDDSLFLHQEHE